jgi:hypothetical protein
MAMAAMEYSPSGSAPGGPSTPISVPYAASVVLNMATAAKPVFNIATLTGNIAIDFTGGVDGQEATVITTQDGTGNRTITWNATRCGGSADLALPSASTTASKTDVFGIKYVAGATKPYLVVASNRGFAV